MLSKQIPHNVGLKNKHFSQFWRLRSPDQVPADSKSGEDFLPEQYTNAFSLYPCAGENEIISLVFVLTGALILFMTAPPS